MKNSDLNLDEIAKGMSNISKKLAEMFGGLTEEKIKEILTKSIKPTLSEAERVILENIDKDYRWIARDKDNSLWLYGDRPIKKSACWSNEYSEIGEEFAFYKHLFQFITWQDDEPYNIEELLNGKI